MRKAYLTATHKHCLICNCLISPSDLSCIVREHHGTSKGIEGEKKAQKAWCSLTRGTVFHMQNNTLTKSMFKEH